MISANHPGNQYFTYNIFLLLQRTSSGFLCRNCSYFSHPHAIFVHTWFLALFSRYAAGCVLVIIIPADAGIQENVDIKLMIS